MKTIITVVALMIGINFVNAQKEIKRTIVVAKPFVKDLYGFDDVKVAKLIQLELIKIDKYSVYDEFDMAEVLKEDSSNLVECYGIHCLAEMGNKLNADFVISGRFDGLPGKIAISLKIIDAKAGILHKSIVREFDNQDGEVQRMIEVLVKELHEIEPQKELVERLNFKNEVITSNNVGKINNSGPRVGYAYMVGELNEFATRPLNQGGLDIFPGASMIGYQLEGQYVGTENFSALFEGIFNITGLEQGVFIPSLSLLNGFRFGKAGWEIAFGPSIGIKRMSNGFYDKDNLLEKGPNAYYSESDWLNYLETNDYDTLYVDEYGYYQPPSAEEFFGNQDYAYSKNLDKRGNFSLTASWVFALGRTFKAGALNIPVNVFYSSTRGGGMAGVSVGFNVVKNKRKINN